MLSVFGRIHRIGRRALVELDDVTFYRERLSSLFTKPDQRVEVTVKTATRSREANAYLFSVVYGLLAEETGHTVDDLHDYYCAKFLPNERKRIAFVSALTGEEDVVTIDTRRSSKLTGTPFYDFVEQVRGHAREFFGVETPDPNPNYWKERKRRKDAA